MTIAELRAALDQITLDRLAPIVVRGSVNINADWGWQREEPISARVERVEQVGGRVIVFTEQE